MKHVSKIGWFVGLAFMSLFIFFLSEGNTMTREKKRLNYAELEDHVASWALNQVELLRCAVDEINDDAEIPVEHRIMLFDGIATQFQELLTLMSKINHDERHVFDWVTNFVNRYKLPDPEPLEQ
ncbi:MAG TPA: hypothetical protein VL443_06455 [Cyclobacteriaceae bacterium]|jgi:hypothetical protein|nr:hypothetical protein [Cyclobacteriaceae bacterium]